MKSNIIRIIRLSSMLFFHIVVVVVVVATSSSSSAAAATSSTMTKKINNKYQTATTTTTTRRRRVMPSFLNVPLFSSSLSFSSSSSSLNRLRAGGGDGADDDVTTSKKNNDGDNDNDAPVGLKQHKKSNAVGDPDGNSSDDDDDDEDETDTSEWEEFLEEMEELGLTPEKFLQQQQQQQQASSSSQQKDDNEDKEEPNVQVELELVEQKHEEDVEPDTGTITGGVRVASRRRRPSSIDTTSSKTVISTKLNNNNNKKKNNNKMNKSQQQQKEDDDKIIDAWSSYIYMPPQKSGLQYLQENSKSIDSFSKVRLDRRTLYGCLLQEWGAASSASSSSDSKESSSNNKSSMTSSRRKFLNPIVSQQLQASLSLATQPKWRKSFPQASCISFIDPNAANVESDHHFDDGSSHHGSGEGNISGGGNSYSNNKMSTLAMQETMAMSLAHSLGCGFVILDDTIFHSIKTKLLVENKIWRRNTSDKMSMSSLRVRLFECQFVRGG